MGFQISDASGKSYGAKVDSSNRIYTLSTIQTLDRSYNEGGYVHSVYFEVTPAGANDYFFYLKNNGLKNLFITDIRISSTVATELYYNKVSGTPSYTSATDITTTNRNLGSSKTITSTIKYDTDITGLTNEGTIFFQQCPVADTLYHLRTSSNIIIPQGSAVAFQRVAATGQIDCLISIVEGE